MLESRDRPVGNGGSRGGIEGVSVRAHDARVLSSTRIAVAGLGVSTQSIAGPPALRARARAGLPRARRRTPVPPSVPNPCP
jgi:hypothetical protein